jgi:hypothetical protein
MFYSFASQFQHDASRFFDGSCAVNRMTGTEPLYHVFEHTITTNRRCPFELKAYHLDLELPLAVFLSYITKSLRIIFDFISGPISNQTIIQTGTKTIGDR